MQSTRFGLFVIVLLFLIPRQLFAFDHSHAQWDAWLKKFVVVKGPASQVKYKLVKKDPKPLVAYLESLSKLKQAEFDGFTKDQKLAFLINAYNGFTIKLIVDNYPIDSIKDLGSTLGGSPWKKEFFDLLGKKRSLDWIEHDTIREQYKEPRIHFALVCASAGCPALSSDAWVAPKLEKQFASATSLFLNDSERNRYNAAQNELLLSKIFDWYGGDFKKASGTVQSFVAIWMKGAPSAKLKSAKINYLDYNWSLNDASASATSK